jgi:hypothetical protein
MKKHSLSHSSGGIVRCRGLRVEARENAPLIQSFGRNSRFN